MSAEVLLVMTHVGCCHRQNQPKPKGVNRQQLLSPGVNSESQLFLALKFSIALDIRFLRDVYNFSCWVLDAGARQALGSLGLDP